MKVIVTNSYDESCAVVAGMIRDLVNAKPNAKLGPVAYTHLPWASIHYHQTPHADTSCFTTASSCCGGVKRTRCVRNIIL